MKTKNNLLTGVLIGMGLIIGPLILMGTTSSSIDEVGRYQISTTSHAGYNGDSGMEYYIFETVVDTKTGRVNSRAKKNISSWY